MKKETRCSCVERCDHRCELLIRSEGTHCQWSLESTLFALTLLQGQIFQGALAFLEYSLFYHISNMAKFYHTLEYTIRNESQKEQASTRLDTHGWTGVVVSTTYSELIWPGINKMSQRS